MQKLFTYTFQTRIWPGWARYTGATLVVVLMLLTRLGLTDYLPAYPFLLFFIAIFVNAVLFDRGSGAYTVLLSAVLADYFFLEPVGSVQIEDPRAILGLVLYVVIGLATAAIIEALHSTAHNLTLANKQLAATDREKDLLLQEAGHRMKNDLATLTALVRLQERAVQDQTAQSVLASTADRIHVLSRVHERLQRGEGASAVINVADFIAELCNDLKATLMALRPISLQVRAVRCWLPQTQSVALGLILNELVTNSLKYAFPNDRAGTISVEFVREDKDYKLVVRDDGIGILPEQAGRKSSGLGQRLIRSMAAQLGGTVVIEPNDRTSGTCAIARFPIKL